LENTSDRMTKSIGRTLELIAVTLEKITQVNSSVTDITDETIKLGENIRTIDAAMQEVEDSNCSMVENMQQVTDVMNLMTITGNPEVVNRRKYKRMPMTNAVTGQLQASGANIKGKLVNISAGGFAFATSDAEIEDKKGSAIRLAVDNFTVVEGGCLEGTIIRITKNEGTYYLGCRMHEDSKAIEEYVNKKMED